VPPTVEKIAENCEIEFSENNGLAANVVKKLKFEEWKRKHAIYQEVFRKRKGR
jgi:hypothetical protein